MNQPIASTSSGMSTPTTSRSGRAIKPVRQYQPSSQSQSSRPSRSSALNPNATGTSRGGGGGGLTGGSSTNKEVVTKFQLGNSNQPVLPLTRITQNAPNSTGFGQQQAMFTTYPTRMRLGTTSLMQPAAVQPLQAQQNSLDPSSLSSSGGTTTLGGGGGGGPTSTRGSGTSTPSILGGKRQRSTVNYAELGQLSDGNGEFDGDDFSFEDSNNGRSKRGISIPNIVPKKSLVPNASEGPQVQQFQIWGDGKSYLGVLPPSNLVTVQPVNGGGSKARHGVYTPSQTEEELEEFAETRTNLIPIQLDLDYRTFKIRDSFLWNIHEKFITPEMFSKTFCQDLELGFQEQQEVSKQIQEQIEEQIAIAEIGFTSLEEESLLIEKDLRVIINLDVQIGTLHLKDRIEWDLTCSLITPELFSQTLIQDLSLPTSAGPIISTALHEELFRLKKSCLEMGLVGADDWQLRRKGCKPLEGIWREWQEAQTFGPRVDRLTLDELDKLEAERERASRRAKRERLAGGPRVGRPRR
ncbi:hypothetical protein JCM3765_007104 [Sporobolomyces pararoseus]